MGSLCRAHTLRARKSKVKSKTSPNSVCSSGSKATSTAWFTCQTLTWEGRGEDVIGDYRKGDMVQAVVSEVDVEKERISLSIKALAGDNFADAVGGVKARLDHHC